MVAVKKGILVACDPPMKRFLVHLDNSRALGQPFIIYDLDETHLLIDSEILPTLKDKIDSLMQALAPDIA